MEVVTEGTGKEASTMATAGKTGMEAAASDAANDIAAAENKPSALEAFLQDEANKAAYDTAVSDAVKAALEQQKAEEQEKQRKAKLTADQRVAEKEQELADREAKLQAAEWKSAAVVAFGEAKIPAKLADCLNYSGKEAYEQSLAAVKDAFQEAVEQAVNDRLRGKLPLAAASAAEKDVSGRSRTDNNDFAAIVRENQARR